MGGGGLEQGRMDRWRMVMSAWSYYGSTDIRGAFGVQLAVKLRMLECLIACLVSWIKSVKKSPLSIHQQGISMCRWL